MSSNENQTATMPVLKILHSSDEAMRALLKEHGYSVDRFSAKVPTRNTTQEVELVPLPGGWLRLAMDESRAAVNSSRTPSNNGLWDCRSR